MKNVLIDQGYISVRKHPKFPFAIYNYTKKTQYESFWCEETIQCRGLIINHQTGEIVARAFDKFFNWLEGERCSQGKILSITEKLDGSLGILYRYQNQFFISTRGSFESDQAKWATKFLNENYNLEGLDEELTLIFEIIYPENRIVADYGDRKDLVLLAARNRFSGEYLTFEKVKNLAYKYNFSLPQVYEFKTVEDILVNLPLLDSNSEGWVVEFDDQQRFKFKGDEYKKLHKLLTGLTFKNTLECVYSNSLDQLFAVVPDEFLGEIKEWVKQIETIRDQIKTQVEILYELAPKTTKKEYALWVTFNHQELAPYLFAKFDNKNLDELIYKLAYKSL